MSASREVSITYNFHFIQERMSSFSLLHNCIDETMDLHQIYQRQICCKTFKADWKRRQILNLNLNLNIVMSAKSFGTSRHSTFTHQFTWSCKLERDRGGTLGISGWGCAAGTLEPLTYTRASSAEFCYPILE